MVWSCPDVSRMEATLSRLTVCFLKGNCFRCRMEGGNPTPPPDWLPTHTRARFNKFKLNLACACGALLFPSRVLYSASITIKYIKEHIEQSFKYGGGGSAPLPSGAYPNVCLHLRPFPSIEGRRPGGARRDRVCRDTPAKTRPDARKGAPGRLGPVRATIRAAVAAAIGAAAVLSATPLWGQTAWQSNGGRGGGGYSAPLGPMTFILHVAKETNR